MSNNIREFPISKHQFLKIMKKLKEHDEYIDKLYDVFKIDFENIPYIDDELIQLLDVVTNESEWVSYFIYELNFGQRYTEGTITIDDIPVDISTPEKLYDMLKTDYDRKYKDSKDIKVNSFNGWEVQLP